jgi:hypothetical protein
VATLEAISPCPPRAAFLGAACHALLAQAAAGGAGSTGSAAVDPIEADRAMDLLRQAVAMGHRDPVGFRAETALAPLRDRADFRLLLMDLEMPDEPFDAGWPDEPSAGKKGSMATTAP